MADDFGSKKALEREVPKFGKQKARLNYEKNIRPFVKTGDLFFFSGDHWLSGLIRWRSKSAWSHVGMVIKIEEIDRVFLVESVLEAGVRMIPLSFVVKNYHGINTPYEGRVAWARHSAVNEAVAKQLKISILEQLSKQYDGREFTRVAWRSIMGREKLFRDHKYTCSELIYETFKSAKLKIEYERGFFISPGSIWRNAAVEMLGNVI
jgi:uncharacterized protein YycO